MKSQVLHVVRCSTVVLMRLLGKCEFITLASERVKNFIQCQHCAYFCSA